MRPPIVTVVSRARWEVDLLSHARATAAARILGRCAHPAEVDRYIAAQPVIVCGSETPWLSAPVVDRWRRSGATVAVVTDPDDRVDRLRVEDIRCDVVLSSEDTPERMLAHLVTGAVGGERGRVVSVTGPRGAPGRSEVALALAWGMRDSCRVLLAELDQDAPSLALRLDLGPGPATAAGDRLGRRFGTLEVLTASLPRSPFSLPVVSRLIELARLEFDLVVCDVGPAGELDLPVTPDVEVIVCEASAVSAIRAARLVAEWGGGVPLLVLNRAPLDDCDDALRAIRAATGLEPAAILPVDPEIAWGRPPSPAMVERVRPLSDLILGAGGTERLPGPAQRTAR